MQLSTEQKLGLLEERRLTESLTPEQLKNWIHWRQRLAPKNAWKSMLSTKYRNGAVPISKEEARANDERFGTFTDWLMKNEIESYLRENATKHRSVGDRRVVQIGAGTGLGLKCYDKLLEKGVSLEIYDWSARALWNAEKALRPLVKKHGLNERKVLLIGEAAAVCQSLDRSVAILQIVRVIEHMKEADAIRALVGAGQILSDSMNRIIIGDAMEGEWNNTTEVETCTHYPRSFFMEHIRRGAGRPVFVAKKRMYRDVEKVFTFLTFRSS